MKNALIVVLLLFLSSILGHSQHLIDYFSINDFINVNKMNKSDAGIFLREKGFRFDYEYQLFPRFVWYFSDEKSNTAILYIEETIPNKYLLYGSHPNLILQYKTFLTPYQTSKTEYITGGIKEYTYRYNNTTLRVTDWQGVILSTRGAYTLEIL